MDIETLIPCFNILGGLLYLPPEDESLKPVFNVFSDPGWISSWPCGSKTALQEIDRLIQQAPHEPKDLVPAYYELFGTEEDKAHLKAPPWGSVYIDSERTAFGRSTQELREFLDDQQIGLNQEREEPEDHIGLLLLTAAWMGIAKREKAFDILLKIYILPWAPTYLALLGTVAPHPFYKAIADLTLLTLEETREARHIDAEQVKIHQ